MSITLQTTPEWDSYGDGYTALWAAVMVCAIQDMDKREFWGTVRNWVWAETDAPGSFRWICDMLDLDYDRLQMVCLSRSGRAELLQRHSWRRWLEDGKEKKRLHD